MNRLSRCLLLLICLGSALSCWAQSEAQSSQSDGIRVIEIQHRPAQAVAAELRPFLSPAGILKTAGRKLLIRTDDNNFEQLQGLAQKLDQPPQALQVEVRFERPADPSNRNYRTGDIEALTLTLQEGKMTRIARQALGPEQTPLPWQRIEKPGPQRQYRELVIAAELLDGRATVNILAISADNRASGGRGQEALSQVNVPLGEWVAIAGRTRLGQDLDAKRYRLPGNDTDSGVYIRLTRTNN